MIVDGRPDPIYDAIGQGKFFSPDSKRVAYRGQRGQRFQAVVDGRQGKAYDLLTGLCFGPDSKHVAYFGARGSTGSIVVDGIEVKDREYGLLVSDGTLVFDTSNILHTLAARSVKGGTELFRVEIEIQ